MAYMRIRIALVDQTIDTPAMDPTTGNYQFDRPVILLAAPRSGSTLLFETLAQNTEFWTIGGESHALFESVDRFNPLKGACDSNALFARDTTPAISRQIRQWFYRQLRDSTGRRFQALGPAHESPRLLEKTPKNALRVSLLNEIFPDALFVYLYRNPRENISSIIDAWRSSRFVTYRQLPGRTAPWSLLLPQGWQSYHDASIEETAAFQWRSANTSILGELGKLERDRWMAVSYQQQVHESAETVRRICDFCQISSTQSIKSQSGDQSKLSRYTLTPPVANKWHKNAQALSRVIPALSDTIDYIRKTVPELPESEFDLSIDAALYNDVGDEIGTDIKAMQSSAFVASDSPSASSRNARCHCGSGKRFKHCHANLRTQEAKK